MDIRLVARGKNKNINEDYIHAQSYKLSSVYCKSPLREENTARTSVQQQQVQRSVSDSCSCVPHESALIKPPCQQVQ